MAQVAINGKQLSTSVFPAEEHTDLGVAEDTTT